MANRDHIRNPVEWSVDQLKTAGHALGETGHALTRHDAPASAPLPAVRRIEVADLKEVLIQGLADFGAYRTDVIFTRLPRPDRPPLPPARDRRGGGQRGGR